MSEKSQIVVLLFYHASQQDQAVSLQASIADLSSDWTPVGVVLADHTTRVPEHVLEAMKALIVFFTPDLDRNENLYHVIRSIEHKPSLERFFVLPEKGGNGKTPFPKMFHTIRAQQHHIFANPEESAKVIDLDAFQDRFIEEFAESLTKISASSTRQLSDRQSFSTRLQKAWNSPRKTVIITSAVLFVAFAFLSFFLFPEFMGALQSRLNPFVAAFQPPAFQSLWLEEHFTAVDPEIWHESNLFRGSNPLPISWDENKLAVYAHVPIEHAVYRLKSVDKWSLDDLRGFQATFRLEPLDDKASSAGLTYQIQLVDQPGYYFGCTVIPAATRAPLQCVIQQPEKKAVLHASRPVTLNEWHTLTVEFLPQTYVLRFFLDGEYFGQAAIPSVEYWRGKDFNAGIQVELQDFKNGNFTCQLNTFVLAGQE